MAKVTTYSGMVGDLQKLLTALAANAEELPELEATRQRLEDLLEQAMAASREQAAWMARKQEASQQLKTVLREGHRLGHAVRLLLKSRYGIRSEKLAEFGMQPFRGRPRKAASELPEPPASPQPPVQ